MSAQKTNENSFFSEKRSNPHFVMTVDFDGWPSLLKFYGVNQDFSQANSQVKMETGTQRILDLFEKHEISATFFVTGDMARNHPEIVNRISSRGHEIACHGLLHLKDEYLASRSEQEKCLKKATSILKEVVGERPLGFRAPCLRFNRVTLDILLENDYLYDSSAIPTLIPGYYGRLNLRFKPYWVSHRSSHQSNGKGLLELPVAVNPLLPIPLSAAWMRNLGLLWVKSGIKTNFLQGNPVVFYVHPRDVLSLPRTAGVPIHLYRNVGDRFLAMLDETLSYVKSQNAVFVKAIDMVQSIRKLDD